MISIQIPPKGNYFHVYAEGVFVSRQKEEESFIITLDDTYPFILYYHFPKCAKIYICCNKETCKNNVYSIFNVDKDFSIISFLEGRRSFDRFKNSMDYLKKVTEGEVYKLPPAYFWQLGHLCKFGLNSRYNLEALTKKYNYKIKYNKDIKWSHENS